MNTKRKIKILLISLFSILLITGVIFGAVLFESFVVSQGNVSAGSIDKTIDVNDTDADAVEISSSTETLTFNNAGDSNTITIQINNRTSSVIQYQYEFAFDGTTFTSQTESFASAILVYYNGEFVDTLGDLCANDDNRVESGYIDFIGLVDHASDSAYSSATDTLTFVLHASADGSIFDDGNSLSFNLRAYARTADYENYMYASDSTEFMMALDDLTTGACPDNVTIVLFSDITLTTAYELNYTCTIDLNGYELILSSSLTFTQEGTSTLTSSRLMSISSLASSEIIILNTSEGALNIEDFTNSDGDNIGYLYSNITTATDYNETLVNNLLVNRVSEKVKYGLASNSTTNILGGLSFYSPSATTTSNLTYSSPNLVTASTNYTLTEIITIGGNRITVKILGEDDEAILTSLLENELAYLVTLSATNDSGVITNTNAADLFLPTSIKDKNVTIEWKSSDPTLLSNTGIIASDLSGDQTVTLTAYIKINDSVYTKTFTIRIMSQNHETIFQYFVAQLSPITLESMYNGSNSTEAYYFLPIVDSNYTVGDSTYEGFDYRSSYTTPEDITEGDSGYSWEGFTNVGFEYLDYSLISTYNFISLNESAETSTGLSGTAVYLSTATFQTFAQISVTGKFANDDEVYSGYVNILIDTGYNTELNELVFTKVSGDLDEVDVLQNILDSRLENGMLNETGDFYLDGTYQTYYISYSIPTASQVAISQIIGYSVETDSSGEETLTEIASISGSETFTSEQIYQIDRYKICLNPEGFDLNDSDFGITTNLLMPTGSTENVVSRIQYFSCPGVIKCDSTGFSNMSVFNSVKYQVWYQLANSITDEVYEDDVESGDYTLATDTDSFTIENSIVTNHTGAYILRHDANLCTTLVFDTTETINSTDSHYVYGLTKLLDWALGTSTSTLYETYNGNISFDSTFLSSYSTYASNGYKYLSQAEEDVIKAYYTTYINTDEDAWDTLWAEITYQQADDDGTVKYVLVNASDFMSAVTTYYSNTSTYGSNRNNATVYKFQEVLQWAHNDKDFGVQISVDGETPDLGVVGLYDWENLIDSDYSSWALTSTGGYTNSKYAKSPYLEDDTEYISTYELEVILAMLLNSKTNSSSGPGTTCEAYVQNLRDSYFEIPRFFTTDGIATLISQAYADLNKSISGSSDSGFSAELTSFSVCGVTVTSPHITSLDGSTLGFDYFDSLTTLYVHGDYDGGLKAFHTTHTLTVFFNRVTSNNLKLINFAAEYCSDEYIDFSIETISNLDSLQRVSLYHNQGITNIGALLKTNMENLTYVDVADINLLNEYSEFTLQAINYKASNPTVYYTPDGTTYHTTYTEKLNSNAEGLIYLEEFYSLLAENAQLAQNVYTEDSSSISIQWVIEEGNGITYVNSSMTSDITSITYPYTNYYAVSTEFTYNSYTFEANHLYLIYSNDDGNIAFSMCYDPNGDEIVLNYGTTIADELTETEVSTFLSTHDITATDMSGTSDKTYNQGSFTETSFGTNSNSYPTNYTNRYVRNTSTSTLTIYDSDGNTLATLSIYSLGTYGTKTRRSTETYYTYSYTNAITAIAYKYYASIDSTTGIYTITLAEYYLAQTDGGSENHYTTTITETFNNWYYCTSRSRSGWFGYTYTFKDLLYDYPNAASIYSSSTSTTYNLYSSTYGYSSSSSTVEDDDSPVTISATSSYALYDSYVYYSAMLASSTTFDTLDTLLDEEYVTVETGKTYYNEGSSITISNTNYKLSLNSSGDGGGFTYTEVSDTTSIQNVKYMNDLLKEANSHLNDKYLGLYYHNYFAYGGSTLSYNGFTYTQYGVYYLELDDDGYFYWAQDSVTNSQSYEVISDLNSDNSVNYEDVIKLVGNLDSTYEGKIYYYNGTPSSSNTNGSYVWYKVMHNTETGAYELRKFGTIASYYDVCNASTGYFSVKTPNLNSSGLYMICNLMKYMDTYTFSTGASDSDYTYGIGGTRTAVVTALVTGSDGTKYSRKFVIEVTG